MRTNESSAVLLTSILTLSFLSIGCSAAFAGPDHGADELWHRQCERGDQSEIERDYPAAERYFRQALTTAEPFGPQSKQMQTSLARMGTVLVLRGHFEEAETYFLQCVTMVKEMRKKGEPDPESLVWLDDFGDAYQEMGRKIKSKNAFCLEHCVTLRNAIAPERHSKLGSACNELAELDMRAGKYAEAEKLLKIQIACARNKYGAKGPIYMPLGVLALTQEKQKKFAEAESNMTKSLALMAQAGVPQAYIEMEQKNLLRIQAESRTYKTTK